MIEYTWNDYVSLYLSMRPYRKFFSDLLYQSIEGKGPVRYTSRHLKSTKKYRSIQNCIKDRYHDRYELMYTIPFEELPLHINQPGKTNQIIITWRLRIGK